MKFEVYDWRANLGGSGLPGWQHGSAQIPHPFTATYPPNYGAIGTYRPSASTTGIPAGTVLTRHDGNMTITVAGTVLDSLDIWGQVDVRAANVVIQRCRVRGAATNNTGTDCIKATDGAVANLVVQDCELVPQTPSIWIDGIDGHDFIMRRCNIFNVVDPVGVWNSTAPGTALNVQIEQNFFHDYAYFTPDSGHSDNQTHNDGVQVHGGTGMTLRGNSIEAYYGTAGSHQPSNTGATPVATNPDLSCVMFNVGVGTTGGHVIEDNWLMGAYLPVNCGGAPGVNLGRIWRNRFSGDSINTSSSPQTINLVASQTCDTGDGTANQNVFDATGLPVTVRHNG